MYFLIGIKFIADMIFDNIDPSTLNFITLGILGLLIVLGVVGLCWNIKDGGEGEQISITQSKNLTDQHFLGYFAIFILFALSFDLTRVSMLCAFVFITIFIGIVYVNNQMYYINPMLNILGFNFYEVSYIKNGEAEKKTAKMFYRGSLEPSQAMYNVKMKNQQFIFADKN